LSRHEKQKMKETAMGSQKTVKVSLYADVLGVWDIRASEIL